MSYGFDDLKTITVADGEVALRIPRRWDVWPHDKRNGYWGCYEKGDADTGTLWIQVDHFLHRGSSEPFLTRETVSEMEKGRTEKLLVEHTITPVDRGHLSRRVYDVVEKGEPLRFWFSRFFLEGNGHSAIIGMNFVLTKAQMDQPEFVELRAIIEREVRNAFLDPFRYDEDEDAETVFGPLERCNFNNWVKLVLPEALLSGGGLDGSSGYQWYFQLEPGHGRPHAGLYVIVTDYPASEEDLAEVQALMRDGAENPALSEPEEDSYTRRTPWGVLSYGIAIDYDVVGEDAEKVAEVKKGPPLSIHLWTYVCRDGDRHRRVRVLLMIPEAEAATPPFPQFLACIDRAVWRAEFPGVEVVAG